MSNDAVVSMIVTVGGKGYRLDEECELANSKSFNRALDDCVTGAVVMRRALCSGVCDGVVVKPATKKKPKHKENR